MQVVFHALFPQIRFKAIDDVPSLRLQLWRKYLLFVVSFHIRLFLLLYCSFALIGRFLSLYGFSIPRIFRVFDSQFFRGAKAFDCRLQVLADSKKVVVGFRSVGSLFLIATVILDVEYSHWRGVLARPQLSVLFIDCLHILPRKRPILSANVVLGNAGGNLQHQHPALNFFTVMGLEEWLFFNPAVRLGKLVGYLGFRLCVSVLASVTHCERSPFVRTLHFY